MWLAIIAFLVGVFVGYKYPQQVQNVVGSGKKIFNDLKEKFSKKGEPPRP
ncbi:MAG: hypothetical protein JRI57_00720 [Deltaproteobacteria bacterium]|nr:hypothetical protein [Deltaproteobacteria bacterium]MBW1952854.1 hypothetical protein [Deltaproteobacteria bacterium]MBW1985852.1 hypothetical protein [Deltaproteobacteria bacterium]